MGTLQVNGTISATDKLKVGDKVELWSDSEGGNIRLTSPNGSLWSIDALNNSNMRFIWAESSIPFTFSNDGTISANYFTGTANYATSAGNSDTVDGYHASNFTKALGQVTDTATVYDTAIASIANGYNSPSGSAFGAFITLPYRKASGNSTPDYAGQIFIPNGDDATTPDGMYYRTALSTSWRNWKSVIHSCSATYFGSSLPSSGMNTGDVFFKT